jgi:hypothetical protein
VSGGGQDRVVFDAKGRAAVLIASSAVRPGRWTVVGSSLQADRQAAGL